MTSSCCPYTVIDRPVSAAKSIRWRSPLNCRCGLAPVLQTLPVQPVRQTQLIQQTNGAVFQDSGANPGLDVGP